MLLIISFWKLSIKYLVPTTAVFIHTMPDLQFRTSSYPDLTLVCRSTLE